MIIATAFSDESSLPFTYLFASHNLMFFNWFRESSSAVSTPRSSWLPTTAAQLAEAASNPELRAACERLGPLPRCPAAPLSPP
jgi:hypothetical protein